MIKLPKDLSEEIKNKIKENSLKGEKGWKYSNQEEDSLLGHFLGTLITDKKYFEDSEKIYEWEIFYNKFRGRGKNALESIIGADAIITLEIIDNITNNKTVKSILFQAKKKGNSRGLKKQKDLMDQFAKGGNFIFTCGPDGYFAQNNIVDEKVRIGNFLADQFVTCTIGIQGMFYDDINNKLITKNSIKNDYTILEEILIKVEIDQ
ncbi:MAG: hypothetical protein ACOH1O_11875 [Flavobacterium sp.]